MKQEIFVFQLYKSAGVILMEDGRLIARVEGSDDRTLLNGLSDELKTCFSLGPDGRDFSAYRTEELNDGYLSAFLYAKREVEVAICQPKIIIVSRHRGTFEWLKEQGIEGEVIAHVSDPAQITGKVVVGMLPLHLAVQAAAIATIDMPDLPADRRGQELTPAEMDAYGARLSVYRVTRG